MQEKDAVILLRKGAEMIVFPGPGGYKIEWSPGSKLLPMESAPSGHLVIPCDYYNESGSVPPAEQLSFMTDHCIPSNSSSSGWTSYQTHSGLSPNEKAIFTVEAIQAIEERRARRSTRATPPDPFQ